MLAAARVRIAGLRAGRVLPSPRQPPSPRSPFYPTKPPLYPPPTPLTRSFVAGRQTSRLPPSSGRSTSLLARFDTRAARALCARAPARRWRERGTWDRGSGEVLDGMACVRGRRSQPVAKRACEHGDCLRDLSVKVLRPSFLLSYHFSSVSIPPISRCLATAGAGASSRPRRRRGLHPRRRAQSLRAGRPSA